MSVKDCGFIAPDGTNKDAVEGLLSDTLGIVLNHLAGANRRPLVPQRLPKLDDLELPGRGLSEAGLLAELDSLLGFCMNQAHAGFVGHMDPMPATASVIGELAAAAFNNNMLSADSAPLFARLEHQLLRVLAREFGLGGIAGGIAHSGATLANLQALCLARNYAFEVRESGMTSIDAKPVILVSDAAHRSLKKAAMLLGLGSRAVVSLPSDPLSRMNVEVLNTLVGQLRSEGRHPFCIVGTAGTTVTGAIDPLGGLADVAYRHGLWFHVDAAHGGALQFSPTHRAKLSGIERADSITFSPQTWFYVSRTSAMLMLRDMSLLDTHYRERDADIVVDDDTPDPGDLSVQGSRFAEVLKLWLTLRHLGMERLSALIDRTCELAGYLHEQVRAREFLVSAGAPEMNLVCFRGEPEGLGPLASDKWNFHLQQHLQANGVLLSLPTFRRHKWLRAVVLNPYTHTGTIDRMFEHIDEFGARDPQVAAWPRSTHLPAAMD